MYDVQRPDHRICFASDVRRRRIRRRYPEAQDAASDYVLGTVAGCLLRFATLAKRSRMPAEFIKQPKAADVAKFKTMIVTVGTNTEGVQLLRCEP